MIIKTSKGRGRKIHIFLDDEYTATTDSDFWMSNYIPDGTEIDESQMNSLISEINNRKAFNKCADLLAVRNHSVKELKSKLLRTVDEKAADNAISKFTQMGYLDDEKFAYELSYYLFNTKHYSYYRVKQELIKRGIDKEIISMALSDNKTDDFVSLTVIINK
ncbi:MAG: RecX family transcriptional regulator, partial [Clostridiales bacterium]|nr:RecX family transcriptional regulator [Clostridiales bacterium]